MSASGDEKEQVQHIDNTGSAASDNESGLDPVREKAILKKVDWRLLPILGALYSVALIDRTNMSNANVAGMSVDLKLYEGERYSIALLMFFVPYFIFELPSNILLRKVGAAVWLSTIVLLWGIVMIGMGFVKTWVQLTILRTVLGLFEAGFFPGCVYLVSCWYVRYEVQKRMAAFYLVSVVVGGFSNILAYGLMQMDGLGGVEGWRWIFIMEGIITCLLGFLSYVSIIDFPDKVREKGKTFITEEEVEIIKWRIEQDRDDAVADELTMAKVVKHLSDWKLWCFALMFMCSTVASYALSFFMPIIIRNMGFDGGIAQVLSAPPYVAAVIIGMSLAVLADHLRMRGPIIVVQSLITITGLILVAYGKTFGPRYFGLFLGISGANANVPAVLSYQSNNVRTQSKRAVSSALQVGFGAIGGIFASTVFRQKDAPGYVPGLWATVGCQLFIVTLCGVFTVYFRRKNAQQQRGEAVLEGHERFTYTY
ncbi:MFS general substrate transporter [Ascodesmis nigricans]|uniref:MFS general substrate transporter n=1 Tax=Ascodesmis nigricans TaxID=341454 RepID=A0A4S2MQ85_9PEZI|nr:MFS general substrate transporter [Ascodesmis nigricans]